MTPELVTVWDWITTPPGTALAGSITAALIIRFVRARRRAIPVDRSPRRTFSVAERREGLARAGGRCEHKHPMWLRCHREAVHADHIYPWSRGGWTSSTNLQMLCQRHNLVKGANPPSRLYLWRLRRRRQRYFPTGTAGRVHWRPPGAP